MGVVLNSSSRDRAATPPSIAIDPSCLEVEEVVSRVLEDLNKMGSQLKSQKIDC